MSKLDYMFMNSEDWERFQHALRVSRTIEPTPIDGTKLGARFEAHVRDEHARCVRPDVTERATYAPIDETKDEQ